MSNLNSYNILSIWLGIASTCGIFINCLCLYYLYSIKTLQNSYGKLCSSKAISDLIILIHFLGWISPLTWFRWDNETIHFVSSMIGFGLLCCWGATVYIQFIISVERFTAICYPVWFSKIFSARHTSAFILIAWMISALQIAAIGILMEVYFRFDPFIFAYINVGSLSLIRNIGGAIFVGVLFLVMLIVDATSIYNLRKRNNIQIRRLSKHRFNRRSTKSQRNIRRRREIILFFQSLITCLILMIQQILFHLSSNFTNPWLNALTNVCPTLIMHSTNGFVLLVFNKEIRNHILTFIQKFNCKTVNKSD